MAEPVFKVIAALVLLVVASPASADCRQFFVKRHAVVVQQVAVAVPYYQPAVYYSAGQSIQEEALAVKVAALVEQKLALRQQQTAPLPQAAPSVFAKCIKCHTGPEAAGGLVLDGGPVDCYAVVRWGRIAGQGKDVPPKMAALVSSMTPEQKGAVQDALLDLVADRPKAQPLPEPPQPMPGELQ